MIYISSKALFDTLLTNLLDAIAGVKAAAVVDRDGLIIHSKIKDINTGDDILGSLTAVFDSFLNRIKTEFGSTADFFNIMTSNEQKLVFVAAGPEAILTVIANISTPDTILKVFSEHIANKIKIALTGEEIDPTIPQIVHMLSQMRAGAFPKGKFSAKVIVLGDPAVGKTSLIHRFVDNHFQESYLSTIGVDISKKDLIISPECHVNCVIWDVGGQKDFGTYRSRFYSGTNCAFIVYSIDKKETFESIEKWIIDLKKSVPERIPIILVANKIDLPQHQITLNQLKERADQLNCYYIETSAKTGANVYDAFLYCAYRFIEKI